MRGRHPTALGRKFITAFREPQEADSPNSSPDAETERNSSCVNAKPWSLAEALRMAQRGRLSPGPSTRWAGPGRCAPGRHAGLRASPKQAAPPPHPSRPSLQKSLFCFQIQLSFPQGLTQLAFLPRTPQLSGVVPAPSEGVWLAPLHLAALPLATRCPPS